jgi:amidohydrolase
LPLAWELALDLFHRPELAYHEVFAAERIKRFLSAEGFSVQSGQAGLKTAFTAMAGPKRGPRIAFLAEMDALPKLGHACGHHLIAGSSAGAAAALVRAFPRLPGQVAVIGCPAEETGGGKLRLARAGVFDGFAAILLVHPDQRTEVYKRSLGAVEIELVFTGRASHASAWPEKGQNALDAVVQTFNAVNLMRQQLPEKQRVHGIISDGGQAPNIIPEHAAARFMARGLTVKETLSLAARVAACAQGAALATGTRLRLTIKKKTMYPPYIPNRGLGEAFQAALLRLRVKSDQGPEDEGMGSTDVGAVSLRAPTLHPLLRLPGVTAGVHTPAFARAAGGKAGRELLGVAIAANALVATRVMLDGPLRRKIRMELEGMDGG